MSKTFRDDLKRLRRMVDEEDREWLEEIRHKKELERKKAKFRRLWKEFETQILEGDELSDNGEDKSC
jgi:hypothetical protein